MLIKTIEINCILKTSQSCHTNEITLKFKHKNTEEDIAKFTGQANKKILKENNPYNKFVDANTPVRKKYFLLLIICFKTRNNFPILSKI